MKKRTVARTALFSAIILLVFVLDRLTKRIVVAHLALGESAPFIPGFLEFRYILNRGAAWGLFSNRRWVFLVITALALIGLPVFLWVNRKLPLLFGVSLSMVIGGAAGNMIDRVIKGSVVDFIATQFIDFPIFNIADCAIVVGSILLFVYFFFVDKEYLRGTKKEGRKETPVQEDGSSEAKSDFTGQDADSVDVNADSADENADSADENADSADENADSAKNDGFADQKAGDDEKN